MKKILTLWISSITLMTMLYGCNEQKMARNFGGTHTISLEKGERLINITWKDSGSLWILTKQDTTKPVTYSFKEKTASAMMEGQVIVKEQ